MVSPKRSLSPDNGEEPNAKRARLDRSDANSEDAMDISAASRTLRAGEEEHAGDGHPGAKVSTTPTLHSQARSSIQRSIAMVLKHIGFDSAAPEALESFTQIIETCMPPNSLGTHAPRLTGSHLDLASMIGETKNLALSSRREHPIPVDFELMLRRHNVRLSSLKPHLKHPLSKRNLVPTYTEAIALDDDAFTTLPILGPELSGKPDKDAKSYIPASFPTFPSKHTYKFTEREDVNIRDPKKIREQAARTAQQGEDALRRLVRASKMRKQKEVKSLVERDGHGKERFRLWELTMKRFMGMEGSGEHPDQVEIADHSMIVNGDAVFSRKEVSRLGKRMAPLTNGNGA
ncbi:Transcription initiation factor TFIID subunit-like protein [Hapsidospora chrysogenum ATCC 11550]|uniref:Transcription initiation factor TFIID subunit 8 n=1 Tax=Hapsidospora chrysogenum (strain ATCC 11550 / CBS 779.69 / DSM 880 / IAM 14645 / JCM 23072 / IMI 49137) TaxID=857340 RepID=A0A086TBS0_HAPC1|nr:Transcription initiation factor TFIID subunit-like protein [Hapsidospora chrysogenum ATCC 11550]